LETAIKSLITVKKIKGLQEFIGISVKKGRTKIQQEEAKKKYMLRSNSDTKKAGPETKKRKLTQVLHDFDQSARDESKNNDSIE